MIFVLHKEAISVDIDLLYEWPLRIIAMIYSTFVYYAFFHVNMAWIKKNTHLILFFEGRVTKILIIMFHKPFFRFKKF